MENLLTSSTVASASTNQYDPMLRLAKIVIGPTTETKLLYDGANMIAGYTYSAFHKRFVFGPGSDEPLVQYNGLGTGLGVRNLLHADERGSIVARTNESGATLGIYSYDEFGIPSSNGMLSQ